MKLVTLALRPLTVGRSASKQWEKSEYFTCPRSRPYRLFRRSDLRVNALYAEHEFIWILATWPWGLGALDMLEPFGPAWGQKLRSLPIFRRSADGKDVKSERMKFTSFVSFGVVTSDFPPGLPSFPVFLSSPCFFYRFALTTWMESDLQDLLKRIDGVAAWSWKPVVKPCFFFDIYIYIISILCGIFLWASP